MEPRVRSTKGSSTAPEHLNFAPAIMVCVRVGAFSMAWAEGSPTDDCDGGLSLTRYLDRKLRYLGGSLFRVLWARVYRRAKDWVVLERIRVRLAHHRRLVALDTARAPCVMPTRARRSAVRRATTNDRPTHW